MTHALVITVSDRSSAGERADVSGPAGARALGALGFDVTPIIVVPDDREAIWSALRMAVDSGIPLVVTTGGTGLGPRDVTPEATAAVIEREVPGIAELLRAASRDRVPAASLSRGLAGVADRTLIINLPGSPGAVRDGIAALVPILWHAVDQITGGDHHVSTPSDGAH
ncbi:MAG: molybdenum cofactor synthesis domain protein [Frankiales bacterium]|nr:molybdenum cofactor synthesis domain protein [Frankiales bacterium]